MAAITSRYGRAFADVIFTSNLDAVKTVQDVEQLASLIRSNADLRNVLENPSVPHPQKLKLLDAITAQAGFDRPVRNFVAILIDKRRLNLFPEIAAQLKTEINERLGFAEAEVVSSRELGPDERSSLEAQMGRVTGKKVRAKYSQDKNVLGGAVIKIGSTIYDGSVRGQLEQMRAAIAR